MEAYHYIIEKVYEKDLYTLLMPFIYYFEKMYVGNSIKEAVFEFRVWSVSERILHDYPRTTNNIEAWHNGFNNLVNKSHPNLGRFINMLQIEPEKIRTRFAKYKIGDFEIRKRNYERELKLKIALENEIFFTVEDLFSVFDELNGWAFSD